jgi:hypothetical protein
MMRFPVWLATMALVFAGCGGERQDAGEPDESFALEVVDASFPERQSVAEAATLALEVRNIDDRELPDLAVTLRTERVGGDGAPATAFATASDDPRLADPDQPVWILDAGPTGGETAATNTWATGPLPAGDTTALEWDVTAVAPGDYTVSYSVSPGLFGKATAADGEETTGSFDVTISDDPVPARVNSEGEVVRGTEPGDGAPRDRD